MIDLTQVTVGIVPALVGLTVLLGGLGSGFVCVTRLATRVAVLEASQQSLKDDLDEIKTDLKAVRDHLMGRR